MIIRITVSSTGSNYPPGKLADAEIIFGPGPLEGLRLIGFHVWERRGSTPTVMFPSRQYSINGERRSFALMRPVDDKTRKPADSTAPLRALILAAYDAFQAHAERNAVVDPTFDYIVTTDAQATYPDTPQAVSVAAQDMIAAFGGDCPKWLQPQYDALVGALEAMPNA